VAGTLLQCSVSFQCVGLRSLAVYASRNTHFFRFLPPKGRIQPTCAVAVCVMCVVMGAITFQT
jgi:hypothetical protein